MLSAGPGNLSGDGCRAQRSTQYLREVYSQESGITERVVWHVVKQYAERLGVSKLAPHDLRRSCAASATIQDENWSKFNFCLCICTDDGEIPRFDT